MSFPDGSSPEPSLPEDLWGAVSGPPEKTAALARFQAGLAHDLNNRLTTLLGNLMLMEELYPDDQDLIGDLLTAAQQSAHLIRLTQTFVGQDVFPPHPVDVRATLLRLDDLARRLLGAACAFETILPDDPVYVEGDEGGLEQLVLGLLSVQAVPRPPPVLTLSLEVADGVCRLCFRGESVRVPWSDAVRALPSGGETLLKLFGAGVAADAGSLRLTMPLQEVAQLPAEDLPPPDAGHRVILAEGNAGLRQHLQAGLTRWGYSVQAVGDFQGLSALEMDTTADICLCDGRLPGLPGNVQDIPRQVAGNWLWLISGAEGLRYLPEGAVYLAKPFSLGDLHRVLQNKLSG